MTMFPCDDTAAISALPVEHRAPPPNGLEEQVVGLFEQLRIPVLRYLMSRGIPVSDAEEIVQEVFLLLFQNFQSGKVPGHTAGWVFGAARNFALRYHERARKAADRYTGSTKETEEVADSSVLADEALEEAQRQSTLMAVVRALPAQDQECLHLRAEGLRYRQIANVLGLSLGTVCNSLQRSLARLTRAERR